MGATVVVVVGGNVVVGAVVVDGMVVGGVVVVVDAAVVGGVVETVVVVVVGAGAVVVDTLESPQAAIITTIATRIGDVRVNLHLQICAPPNLPEMIGAVRPFLAHHRGGVSQRRSGWENRAGSRLLKSGLIAGIGETREVSG